MHTLNSKKIKVWGIYALNFLKIEVWGIIHVKGVIRMNRRKQLKVRHKYLEQLIAFKDTEPFKVITGIRRCGKSSLMLLMQEYYEKLIVLFLMLLVQSIHHPSF